MYSARTARLRGYYFTGCYARETDQLKEDAARIWSLNFECYICSESGGGYSIYADKGYSDYQNKQNLKAMLSTLPDQRARALAKYQAEVAQIDKNEQMWLSSLAKLEGEEVIS